MTVTRNPLARKSQPLENRDASEDRTASDHMIKKTAVLMDGAFISKALGKDKGNDPVARAARLVRSAMACLAPDEELFRIFYYDCAPYNGKKHDLSGNEIDFSTKPQFAYQTALLAELAKQPFVALRLGQVRFRGWRLKKYVVGKVRHPPHSIQITGAKFFEPNFQQKGVDMRVGLDVATLSMDRLVDRIVLVAADSDFIPAMKLARREGVQVALAMLDQSYVPELLNHADLYREPDLSIL